MDEAWRLEEEFWQAGASGRVHAYYARVLTSDAFVVIPGEVLTREELMRQWDHRSPWDSWTLYDRRTALVNGETVVLSYRVTARSADVPLYRAHVSSVYTWVGQWALALRQHTPEPDEAPESDVPPAAD